MICAVMAGWERRHVRKAHGSARRGVCITSTGTRHARAPRRRGESVLPKREVPIAKPRPEAPRVQ